jgi:hypothetical protein
MYCPNVSDLLALTPDGEWFELASVEVDSGISQVTAPIGNKLPQQLSWVMIGQTFNRSLKPLLQRASELLARVPMAI